jgi:hypothetical protein
LEYAELGNEQIQLAGARLRRRRTAKALCAECNPARLHCRNAVHAMTLTKTTLIAAAADAGRASPF